MTGRFDIAVIGGGVAGLTAVRHAGLSGLSVAHILGTEPIGGLVCNVGELQGYPTGLEAISGIDLAVGLMSANAADSVTEVLSDAVALTREVGGFRVSHGSGELIAEQVIAATGAGLRMLDIPGAQGLVGRGVSQCAWCDGPLSKDKPVVVVGGGDAAFEEALHLSDFAAQVTLLIRGERPTARQSYIDRVSLNETIDVRLRCDVIEVIGSEAVSAVRVVDRAEAVTEELACSGLFVFIGLQPNSQLFSELAVLDPGGGVATDAKMETRTPGLFAIGAVRYGYGGRLVHAVGEAAVAATAAAERAKGHSKPVGG